MQALKQVFRDEAGLLNRRLGTVHVNVSGWKHFYQLGRNIWWDIHNASQDDSR